MIAKIGSSADSPISNLDDVFNYDSSMRKYKSEKNTFEMFVKKEIAEFKHETEKTQLISE
jgi:hypothetical protein